MEKFEEIAIFLSAIIFIFACIIAAYKTKKHFGKWTKTGKILLLLTAFTVILIPLVYGLCGIGILNGCDDDYTRNPLFGSTVFIHFASLPILVILGLANIFQFYYLKKLKSDFDDNNTR